MKTLVTFFSENSSFWVVLMCFITILLTSVNKKNYMEEMVKDWLLQSERREDEFSYKKKIYWLILRILKI
ncbi:uncharacterized protein MONOS_6170 [Monocercomonoides exilis]|uniref:uncharacterized protein n=1 Tax=Monocercomonoides exilis TaxID=2049356 RepID=UPI00355ABFA2|nr:hypothetical protein MONOS_6170 [Monocercomonoides exilis]|eukprot:MONOS_6170.1-p1 / transcript=MONOS_6170.1 / gene=MONOS_6170 / organism=Monocercomonoides_exilis_PA203 / gene_product=unspecified product / transcript_product=unspecified product / location=Mono_scaffold00191:5637-5987(+) / protein_length=70 / sequence_SO=supercontig / SO=protein_coding / is_pseudo=false